MTSVGSLTALPVVDLRHSCGQLRRSLREAGAPRARCGTQAVRAASSRQRVPPLEGAFIVNIGELLEVATGGYLRATEHRVNLHGSAAERISVPFFFDPRLDAQIPVLSLPDELAARGVMCWSPAEDSSDPIFSVYGRNAWKSRLRAHPDVADAHGYSSSRVG
jgi:isopenicillin N synthase-like dioxygenase